MNDFDDRFLLYRHNQNRYRKAVSYGVGAFLLLLKLFFIVIDGYIFIDYLYSSCDSKLPYNILFDGVINLIKFCIIILKFKYQDSDRRSHIMKFNKYTNIFLYLNSLAMIISLVFYEECVGKMEYMYYYVRFYIIINNIIFPLLVCMSTCCVLFCVRFIPNTTVLVIFNDVRDEYGITSEDLTSLKTYIFSQNKIKDGQMVIFELSNEDDKTCGVCMSEYVENDILRYFKCRHYFHRECVDEWLKINKSCPMCRNTDLIP
jgi:hypothetical protein